MDHTVATGSAPIPMRHVGPLRIVGPVLDESVSVPLATYETPLWPSVDRGARVTARAGGIRAVVVGERMTRSILLRATDAEAALAFVQAVEARREDVAAEIAATSRFARLVDLDWQIVGDLVWLRLACKTGDASGHNMVTLAADRVMTWLLAEYPSMRYGSISGNLCTDKKVSAVNGLLGRGRSVVVECTIDRKLCSRYLKTTPERLVELNIQKNLLGSILAGSLRSANAHVANMLLAFYLATGQDAANIVEGSQAITHAEVREGGLYFSVTLPNLIVGTVGNGKGLDFVQANLEALGCRADREPGANARRLAAICAATVLCGELSLLAAQTNPGELMAAHVAIERAAKDAP